MLGMLGGIYGLQPQFRGVHRPLYKDLQILCQPRWRYSSTGLPIGPLSGLFTKSAFMLAQWSTPFEAHVVDTEAEAMYVSLLFGIRDRYLARIDGGFASGLYNVLTFIENNWRDLVADVRSGRLKEGLNVSEEHRRVINKYLVPDPERADELEAEFKKGSCTYNSIQTARIDVHCERTDSPPPPVVLKNYEPILMLRELADLPS